MTCKLRSNPEIIRALTPMFLASMGAIIAITALLVQSEEDTKFMAAMGLSGTAIAGAAGLAQETSSNSSEELKDTENIEQSLVKH